MQRVPPAQADSAEAGPKYSGSTIVRFTDLLFLSVADGRLTGELSRLAGVKLSMTQHFSPARPALAAIAAVIACPSTAALAQTLDAAPPVIVAPPAAEPATPAPTPTPQVIFQPGNPVVQAIPERPVAPVAEAVKEPATRVVETPRERTLATSARDTIDRQAAPAPIAAVTTPSAPPMQVRPNTTETAMVAPPPVAKPELAAPVALSDDTSPDTVLWLLGLGALGVLAGGAVIAARRTRSDKTQTVGFPGAALASKGEFEAVDPSQRFVMREEENTIAAPRSPLSAPAPVLDRSRRIEGVTILAARREAMAAAAPSPENPFLTRKNRIRRANFMLSHERAGSIPAEHRAAESIEANNSQRTHEEVRQVSYSFSNGALKTPVLKPRFN